MLLKKSFILLLVMILIVPAGCAVKTPVLEEDPFIPPEWMNNYSGILAEYQKFADCLQEEDLNSVYDKDIFSSPDESLKYHWNCMVIETNIRFVRKKAAIKESLGYALKDINYDGKDELILLLKDYTVLAVFSLSTNKPKLIDAFWPRYTCAILSTGELYTLGSGGACDWEYSVNKISGEEKSFCRLLNTV